MKRLASILSAAAMSAAMAVTSFAPANAAPLPAPRIAADNGVINVQNQSVYEWGGRRSGGDRYWGGNRRERGDRHWRGDGPRHGWHGGGYYYNGYRGYRHRRHGYRYHDGWWFPAGAFIAGAIIGNAINSAPPPPPRYYRVGGSAHVAWCYNRYRSYREWDNTFQPYHGPRQQCYSPYS